MIYVCTIHDYEFRQVIGVYEGPDYLIIDKIRDKFYASFDHRTLGKLTYPEYKGPVIPYKSTKSAGGFSSGFITVPADGSLVSDESSREHKQWIKACERVRKDWDKRYKEQMEYMRSLYPGKDTEEMFISYLKKEFSFKEIAYQEFTP